jgi:hypothetical protein
MLYVHVNNNRFNENFWHIINTPRQYTVEPNKNENKKAYLFLGSGITNGLFSAGVEKNFLIN